MGEMIISNHLLKTSSRWWRGRSEEMGWRLGRVQGVWVLSGGWETLQFHRICRSARSGIWIFFGFQRLLSWSFSSCLSWGWLDPLSPRFFSELRVYYQQSMQFPVQFELVILNLSQLSQEDVVDHEEPAELLVVQNMLLLRFVIALLHLWTGYYLLS